MLDLSDDCQGLGQEARQSIGDSQSSCEQVAAIACPYMLHVPLIELIEGGFVLVVLLECIRCEIHLDVTAGSLVH